jgi:hypothetical protein
MKDLLIIKLEKMGEADRGKRLDNPKVMPSGTVCCTNCEIALWLIIDRTLTCVCPKTGKASWMAGELMTVVSTTECGYFLRQEAERELSKRESEEQTPTPRQRDSQARVVL